VQGLILSRLDRLPADRQVVLKVASVIGRLFAMTPLRDTLGRLGWAQRALKPSLLRELTRRGFVVPEALEPELAYLFRHVITHEIVYQTLLFAQRRQVHQALAEIYESASPSGPGPELAPLLAHHWSRAAEGGGDEHSITKAITYLALAGNQAARLGAFPEAIAAYEQGLSLLPSGPGWVVSRVKLLVESGMVVERTGDYPRARERLEEALALARGAAPSDAARALRTLGRIEQMQGRFPEAERFLEEALAIIESLQNRRELAPVWESLGLLSANQGQFDRATERLEAAYAVHEELGNLDGVSASLNTLGIIALFRNDLPAACDYFERALAIARQLGDREGVGLYLSNLGSVAENQRDFVRAERYLVEALEIARELNARQLFLNATLNLAHVAAGLGNLPEASARYRTSLQGAVEMGALPTALEALAGMATLDRRSGQPTRAAERLGFILAHPAFNADVALRTDPLLGELRTLLGEDELRAALARGESGTIDEEAALAGGSMTEATG
jgi:adenylate cyclase